MSRFLLALIVFTLATPLHAATPARLRCEHLENPIGIDTPRPRLSWQIDSDRRGEKQTAYQVVISDVAGKPLWDSGKIDTDLMQVTYDIETHASSQAIAWKVRVWDADGKPSDYSTPASFESGLLKPDDWHGKWIG